MKDAAKEKGQSDEKNSKVRYVNSVVTVSYKVRYNDMVELRMVFACTGQKYGQNVIYFNDIYLIYKENHIHNSLIVTHRSDLFSLQ